jgi:hypothetical protein
MDKDQNIPDPKSEDKNSELKNEQKSQHIPEEIQALGSPQTVSSNQQPTTVNYKPETETMEVHKHLHHVTQKKKWGEYLLEFLMLFLAVFLGFLAENVREHSVEREREKQYMRSMVKDLGQDIRNINLDLENRRSKHQIADSLAEMFLQHDPQSQTSFIYFCARRFSVVGYIFHMTDGTLMQLKNSGGLRLVRKGDVVDSLQDYYNLFQQHEDNRELEMLQLRDYRDVMVRIFDVKIFEAMIKNFPLTTIPPGNPPLLNNDRTAINELLMRIQLSKRINLVNIQRLTELKGNGLRLMEQIKKQYHLDE